MKILIGSLLLFAAVIIVLYISALALDAYMEAKRAPRVDMFNCTKHGLIPNHLCVTFNEKQTPGAVQELHCPFCFEDAFKVASKRLEEKDKERIRV